MGPVTLDADTEVLYVAQFSQIEDGRYAMDQADSKEISVGFKRLAGLLLDRLSD